MEITEFLNDTSKLKYVYMSNFGIIKLFVKENMRITRRKFSNDIR